MKFRKIRKYSETPLESVYTNGNLYLSAMKLLKLVYTTLNISFPKTMVVNLSFSLQILRKWVLRKGVLFQFQMKNCFFCSTIKLVLLCQTIQKCHQHIFYNGLVWGFSHSFSNHLVLQKYWKKFVKIATVFFRSIFGKKSIPKFLNNKFVKWRVVTTVPKLLSWSYSLQR